jgi:hypothetical protein
VSNPRGTVYAADLGGFVVGWMQMQKKCAPSLLNARFHACMAGIPLAAVPPIVGGSGHFRLEEVLLESGAKSVSTAGPDLLNPCAAVNIPDRGVA